MGVKRYRGLLIEGINGRDCSIEAFGGIGEKQMNEDAMQCKPLD